MIGYLAGDIIASPFIRKRPASLFFGLFDTVTDIEVKNSKRVVERTYEAKPTEVSRAALAFVTWLRSDASEREAITLATLFESFGVEADARLYPVLCAVAGILVAAVAGTPVGSTIVVADIAVFAIFSLIGFLRAR